MKNIKVKLISIVTLAMLMATTLLSGCGASSPTAATAAADNSKSAAQPSTPASTKLVLYSALNDSDITWIKQQFKQDTGIEIENLNFSAGDAAARVVAEKAAPKADVMIGGSVEFYDNIAKEGVLEKYTSPNTKGLDNQFIDPNGYWQGWYMGVLGIVYNTDRFKNEMAPKGIKEPVIWDDLLNPAYKDLYVTSNPASAGGGYIFAADQLFRLGDQNGWDYLNKLNQNVHHYTATAGDPITLVATGQFIVGMAWAHDIETQMKKGYPIKVVVPDQTAYEIGGAAIVKGGQNTANAKKFIDWLLTKPVQEKNRDNSNRYSVMKNVTPPQGMIPLANVSLVNYDRSKASAMKADVVKKFTEMIGSKTAK
ncbi:Extracellular solute-binding protein family 1 [Candidatus Desulfosporosinus infrequens]|uniref:Extracellular solute-binding protein family 1 n=1 Tax=Candidatus Desulfosporosinus infrequens TaxID=2043169 RepID=A0A2U3LBG2_9FIRM|nr:Extracellular solute-binding protein family 1 [Candidatus Desulfosporosinus infrequens]